MQTLSEFFNANGPLASVIPEFRPREGQIRMAEAVFAAMQSAQNLVVEAGTGTGKTYAYLVPALLCAKRVIISTGTRHLQDQLYHRDLPVLAQSLGRPVKVALLKGRANYLCDQRLQQALANPNLPGLERKDARLLQDIEQWSQRTTRGDIAELGSIPESDPIWATVTSTKDNCLGQACPHYQRCHLLNARRDAQAASVVVVNHHLLLADLAMKEEGFGELLPGVDAVVVDEAHQFADTAAQFFGLKFTTRSLLNLFKDTSLELTRLGRFDSSGDQQLWSLESRFLQCRQYLELGRERVDWEQVPTVFLDEWGDWVADLMSWATSLEQQALAEPDLKALTRRARGLADTANQLYNVNLSTGLQWIERTEPGYSVEFAPFEVADRLESHRQAHPKSWIYTSATLAMGNDFSHFCQRIGVQSVTTLNVESPFDFNRQARLVVPTDIVDPTDPRHTTQVLEKSWPLVESARGRTFFLFTSFRALNQASVWVRERLKQERLPWLMLVQGDAPRDALIRQFRQDGQAILLGTASFWEGVDVRGEALSVVIIDKLPFQSPDDPMFKARLKGLELQGLDGFRHLQIPQAVLALKQGMGRLIRDTDDYGVVLVGDRRLKTKGYGKQILKALPPMPMVESVSEAQAFLIDHLSFNDTAGHGS